MLSLVLMTFGCGGDDDGPTSPGDTTRPAVMRLSVETGQDSVRLSWHATGDDSLAGRAFRYDIRYATAPITGVNWPQATRIEGLPAPDKAGVVQFVTLRELDPLTDYWFGAQAIDEEGNRSILSPIVTTMTWERAPTRILDWPGDQYYPDWSPDGRMLCFLSDPASCQCNEELWILDLDTGESRMLYTALRVASPHWFPEGERLIFCAPDTAAGAQWDLLTISVDGGPAVPVAPQPLGSVDCALSADGSLVAYTVSTWTANSEEIMSYSFASGAVETLVSGEGADFNPAWSPQGALAYVSTRNGPEVWLKDVPGGSETRIAGFTTGMVFRPSWSPGGGDVVMCWDRTAEGGSPVVDLWSARVDTEELSRLTAHPDSDRNPAWSPDENRIAFASDRDGDYDIYVLDPGSVR
jgi:dipeptidyl aminopeptidase/acylaminoacyl peptidase